MTDVFKHPSAHGILHDSAGIQPADFGKDPWSTWGLKNEMHCNIYVLKQSHF